MSIARIATCSLLLLSGALTLPVLAGPPTTTKSFATTSADKLFEDDKYDQARTAYAAAVKATPKNAVARIGLIRSLMRMDEWETCITESRAAVAADPQNAEFHGLLALSLMRQGKPEEAIKEADAAAKINKDTYWSLLAQGRARVWQYQSEEAQTMFRKAAKLDPDIEEGWIYLIKTFDESSQEEENKVIDTLLGLREKKHPTKTKTPEEAAKRKSELEKSKAERVKLATYYHTFDKMPPFQGVSLYSEETIKAADEGSHPPITFSFPIERGIGENGKDDIIIPITLDGIKMQMLFDTGAGRNFVLGKLAADRLNLPTVASRTVGGVNGSETSKLHQAERLTIGKQTYKNIPFESLSNSIGNHDGLIGGGVFDKYVVTADLKDNTLTLTRGKDAVAPKPLKGDYLVNVPFHYYNGYIFVLINVEGNTIWTMLDTGAQGWGVLSLDLAQKVAKQKDKSRSIDIMMHGRNGIGVSETDVHALLFTLPVDIGCIVGDRTPYFVEMDYLMGAETLNKFSDDYDFRLAGLLGMSYLGARCHRVSIDYPHHILTMEMPEALDQ